MNEYQLKQLEAQIAEERRKNAMPHFKKTPHYFWPDYDTSKCNFCGGRRTNKVHK